MLAVGVQSYLEFKLFQERCSAELACVQALSVYVLVSLGVQLEHRDQPLQVCISACVALASGAVCI